MTTANASLRLQGLDTLRAFAIVAVMLYHLTIFGELPAQLLPVTYYGWMGVDLFFVLSGFLIGQQALRPYLKHEHAGFGEFYRRRAFRILPAYLAVLGLYVLFPAVREYPRMSPLWKFLTFTMNFGFRFDRRCFSHAWSLCVEEQFYLVLPLLVALMMRRPSTRRTIGLLAGIVLFGIVLRAWLIRQYPEYVWTMIYYPSETRLDGLVAGVGLAAMKIFRPHWWQAMARRGHLLALLGVLCVAVVLYLFRNQDLGNDSGPAAWGVVLGLPLLAAGLGLIVASSVSDHGVLARVKIPGAQTLATLAFSLYLTHKAVGYVVMTRLAQFTAAKGPASWLLYAAACLAAAWMLHILVEQPFLRLRDRLARGKTRAALALEMRREPAI